MSLPAFPPAGVLFDLPPVIEAAAAAATGRLRLQAGDFFKDPLPAADTYLIMDVIHDWDDEQTTALVSGNYVDPNAGRVTFCTYFERWAARQVWAPGTERAMYLAGRSVTFWDVPMRMLVRSHIEAWVRPQHSRSGTSTYPAAD